MKRSVVPAQITTVEDRIFGGLTPYQLILLLAPVCFGFILYVGFPPNLHLVIYKMCIMAVLELLGAALSIRVKDKILFLWVITVVRYNVRAQYYLYNKNDAYLRTIEPAEPKKVTAEKTSTKAKAEINVAKVGLPDAVKLQAVMSDPRAKLRYIAGKDGKLNVVIQEIK